MPPVTPSPLRRRVLGARPLSALLAAVALSVGLLAATTPAASASSSATATRSITAESPTSGIPQNDPNSPCRPGTSSHYAVVSFTVEVNSGDTISATVQPHGFRATAALFQPSYLPSAPQADCWDNNAVTGGSSGSSVSLSTYFGTFDGSLGPGPFLYNFDLVVWGATAADLGSFDVSLSSSGTNLAITPLAEDTTPPVVTVPDTTTAELTGPSGAAVTYTATAQDDVDGTLTPTCSPASGATFPKGTTTVTCTATDSAGNQGEASFDVTVVDTTPPTVTAPGNVTREATGSLTAVDPGSFASSDAGGVVSAPCPVPTQYPVGLTTVSCTATDASGNRTTKSFTVTITDTTAPAVAQHGDVTAEATSSAGAVVTYTAPAASDLVDGTVASQCLPASGSTFPLGTTPVTCTATDAHRNTGESAFDVTVSDTQGPVLTLPSSQTAEATSPAGAAVTWPAPTATDAVDGPSQVTCDTADGAVLPLGTTTVHCEAADQHGHTSVGSFDVVVRDTTAPTLSGVPSDQTLEATGPNGATASWAMPTATDLAGPAVVNCDRTSGDGFTIGTSTVTCVATDAAGNTASATFTVTVRDTTPPVVQVPDARRVEAVGPDGAHVAFTASASDLVDGAVTTSCSPASGDLFPLGTTTVTCTAADTRGNDSAATFAVTVSDTTAPAIQTPSVPTAEATGADGATVTFDAPSATDAVDGHPVVTCDHASGDLFPLGTTTVSCSSVDAAGNAATATYDVTVADTTAPAISALTDVTAEATGPDGATITYAAPTASDLVDGSDSVACDPASGSVFALGTTVVTCASTDAAGNRAQKSFGITVSDTSAPVLTLPADVTAEATGPDGAVVTFDAPSATDAVDGARTVTCDHDSGATYPLGTTTVLCSASDASGHSASAHFTVTVADTTPPSVTVPDSVSVPAANRGGAVATYSASAQDLVDGSVPTICSPASASHFDVGTTTVTCRATDAAGNTGTASFDVTVRGVRDPSVTARPTSAVEPGATGWYRAPVTVRFSCRAGSARVLSCPAPVTVRGNGVHHVTRTVRTADGGAARTTVTVRIDRSAPRIDFTGARAGATYTGGGPRAVGCTARDSLSGVTSCAVRLQRSGPHYRWTATARDRAGNVRTATLSYRVLPALFAGVPMKDGRALVQAGHSYQFRVYAVTDRAPTYLAAAVAPQRPTPTPTSFLPAGGHWWTVRVTIDRGMAGRDWVVGARVGANDYLVTLRVAG